jgi:signal transduction histidine kinase
MPDEPANRIMIVDDEAPQMKALCNTLLDHGYETIGFTAAPEALSALRQRKFDLLLADLNMPGMDGIALLRAALEIDPDLVGIIMTGQGTIDTAVEAMKTGALDYILKPFKLSVILPVLSRAVAVRQLRIENATLAQRVREHAAELQAANKDLESFAHSVSHDLKAPVRAIDAYAQILIEDTAKLLPENDREFLLRIQRSAREMGALIEGLLQLSRLGRQTLSKQAVHLSALINDVLEEVRREYSDRQVEVRVHKIADCVGDPTLLRQVFVNLLSNAFKFTRGKENALVEVGCREQDAETIYFVRDNGAGFDMQYADKLFGVFQRLHSGTEFEGSGVGLSIVQRIIERHGGRIWAEAEVGKGAAFYFTLAR